MSFPKLFSLLFVALVSHSSSLPVSNSTIGFSVRAYALADRLITCSYDTLTGTFVPLEELWESGNTLESLSNAMGLLQRQEASSNLPYLAPGRLDTWQQVLTTSFALTPVIVDNCFDDHQWWLLAWARAYDVMGNVSYIERSAAVFDYIVANGWTNGSAVCNGGVDWCPSSNPYKNAITNELFLTSAMALHPYASLLGKPTDFYLGWAKTEWEWFLNSSMLNPATGLINDGLNGQTCLNNGQTTWTYNQGVLLDGLGALAAVTGNDTLVSSIALGIIKAVMSELTIDGILVEPCQGTCDDDQRIFKGIFMRHLGYLAATYPLIASIAGPFIAQNALSVLAADVCYDQVGGGGYGLRWEGPCDILSVSTDSAALDLLLAAATIAPPVDMQFQPFGIGNCADTNNNSMSNCYQQFISEEACKDYAFADILAVGYDFETQCGGSTACRVRTLATSCGSGFQYVGGTATEVNATDGLALTTCVIKTDAAQRPVSLVV